MPSSKSHAEDSLGCRQIGACETCQGNGEEDRRSPELFEEEIEEGDDEEADEDDGDQKGVDESAEKEGEKPEKDEEKDEEEKPDAHLSNDDGKWCAIEKNIEKRNRRKAAMSSVSIHPEMVCLSNQNRTMQIENLWPNARLRHISGKN